MRQYTLLMAVLLTGCYASGVKVPHHSLVDLQPGLTTCPEIRQRYGPPTSATLSSGGHEQLVYSYTQMQLKPESFIPLASLFIRGATSESTTVTFDCTAGVLQGYTATQGEDTVGTGFLSGGKK